MELEQDYAHLFYWREAELPEGKLSARYFRLTAVCSTQLELGELALFDQNGSLVTRFPMEAAPLCLTSRI